jgi:hypothetical protein
MAYNLRITLAVAAIAALALDYTHAGLLLAGCYVLALLASVP